MSKSVDPRRTRRPGPDPRLIVFVIIFGLVVVVSWTVAAAMTVAALVRGEQTSSQVTFNPVGMTLNLLSGRAKLDGLSGAISLALLVAIAMAAVMIWIVLARRQAKTVVDRQAKRYLSSNRDIASMSKKAAAEFAKRNFSSPAVAESPGLRIGHIPQKKSAGLYSTWEDLFLIIFGPRMGKTTTQVIPAIVDAPGPTLTTSNKRDIVDDTIGVTGARGQVYVFDPQNIAVGIDQTNWFFDPLDYVRRDPQVMDSAAMALADIFLCASRPGDGSGGDVYFSEAGRDLLGRMFLAAALNQSPIGDVFTWVNDDSRRDPLVILKRFPEWSQQAEALKGTYGITEKTRSGIFSQAQQMASALGRRAALQWVTPRAGAQRFSAYDFVRSAHDTLYLLSKEGADNAAALTTSLVAMVMVEAEKYGEECGGRLPVPLIAALDEAANVVRWPELPRLYSHYGSRSIILMTILQSYAQGVGVWGEHGMEALWSASSVLMYGGGVRDDRMLQKLEALVGEASEVTTSTSSSRDGRSTSTSHQDRKILTVSELASMPAGRAVVFAAKRRPLIAELEPWRTRSWPRETREQLGAKK